MNAIQAFNFNENEVRVVVGEDGEPWFVAKDICDVLEHSDVSMAIRSLDEDEKGTSIVCTLGGDQQMSIINESGLYALVLRSRKPEAKKFRKWVTVEVLPSIRKHGAYMTDTTIDELVDNPDLLIQLATKLKFEKEQRLLMERQRDEAIRTKAWIGTRREATAMATASVEKRRAEVLAQEKEILAEQVGDSTNWKTVKSIKWIPEYFAISTGMWSAVGKRLTALSHELDFEIRHVEHSDYGTVNAYHVDVIARLKAKLDADPNMLQKYRPDFF